MAESPEPWRFSHAKDILTQQILEGTVTQNSNPNNVYSSNDEYMRYDIKKFKSNLKSLLKSLDNKEERAQFDIEAVAHDMALFPRAAMTVGGYPFWDTSEAKLLLTNDIEQGVDLQLQPRDLWNSREAYKLFPYKIFLRRIHQERRNRTNSTYWHVIRNRENNQQR
jgi:hypothetical protein